MTEATTAHQDQAKLYSTLRESVGNMIVKSANEAGISNSELRELIVKHYNKPSNELSDDEMLDLTKLVIAKKWESGKNAVDLPAANKELEKFNDIVPEIEAAVAPILEIKVTDEESKNNALAAGKEIKKLSNKVEARRVELKAPYLDMTRNIDARAQKITEPLAKCEKHLAAESLAYNQILKKKAEEERKKLQAQREAEEAAAKAKEAAKKAELETANLFGSKEMIEGKAAEVATVQAENASVAQQYQRQEARIATTNRVQGVRTYWTFEIEDITKIDRAFLMLNEPSVNKAIRENTVNGECNLKLDGIRIFQTEKMSFRG